MLWFLRLQHFINSFRTWFILKKKIYLYVYYCYFCYIVGRNQIEFRENILIPIITVMALNRINFSEWLSRLKKHIFFIYVLNDEIFRHLFWKHSYQIRKRLTYQRQNLQCICNLLTVLCIEIAKIFDLVDLHALGNYGTRVFPYLLSKVPDPTKSSYVFFLYISISSYKQTSAGWVWWNTATKEAVLS